MVYVKDSTKWVRDNCLMPVTAKKRDRKGDDTSSIGSFPPSPASSTRKRSYDTAMSPPEEQVVPKSTREYRPLPKQAQVEPPSKRRHVTFSALPDDMFYTKLRRASHPISFFDPLKNQKMPASSSRSVSQPSTSSSAQASTSTSSSSRPRVSGNRAGPGRNSDSLVGN